MSTYDCSDRAPRRNADDIVLPMSMADESLIADTRGDPRPTEVIDQRLQRLMGDRPVPFGESWDQRLHVTPGVIALEMVGDD